MDERQKEKSAQCNEQDVLFVTQDLNVYKEVEKVPMNAENAAKFKKGPIDWPEVRNHKSLNKSKKNAVVCVLVLVSVSASLGHMHFLHVL